MSLAGEYEAADGEYLKKIRDALQREDGKRTPLWKGYLDFRGIPYETARDRIWKAEGHVTVSRDKVESALSPAPQPSAFRPATEFGRANWREEHAYDDEPRNLKSRATFRVNGSVTGSNAPIEPRGSSGDWGVFAVYFGRQMQWSEGAGAVMRTNWVFVRISNLLPTLPSVTIVDTN